MQSRYGWVVANEISAASQLDRWIAYLDGEIALAAANMEVELGEESACTVHKDGRVTGGLKYQEGRLNSFAEARRLARDPAGLEDGLSRYKTKWEQELDRRRSAHRPSMPWISYATGGLQAAEAAVEAFKPT
jgi:hypothetical protein